MSETEIIQKLKSNTMDHDSALSHLYESKAYQTPIKNLLKSKGISNTDTDTLWTDIVIRFSTLVRNGKYTHQDNLLGFLFNLSRYILLNFLRQKGKHVFNDIEDHEFVEEKIHHYEIYNTELKAMLSMQLSLLGQTCKQILELWSNAYSMREIKEKLNIASESAVRKRKHICLKKLLHNIESKTDLKEILKSYER